MRAASQALRDPRSPSSFHPPQRLGHTVVIDVKQVPSLPLVDAPGHGRTADGRMGTDSL